MPAGGIAGTGCCDEQANEESSVRKLARWSAALITSGQCVVATAYAQAPPSASAPEETGRNPALQYTVAFLAIIAIMLVVCAPSRKS
jgi:hypothetical protein